MALYIAALVIILLIIIATIFFILDLANWPGNIAKQRGHPQAEAVRVAGLIGIFTVLVWPLALVWAYIRYPDNAGTPARGESMGSRSAALDSRTPGHEAGTEGNRS